MRESVTMVAVILMRNPETGGIARATERAFRLVWKPKGWTQVEPDKVTKADLIDAGEQLGQPVDESAQKAEIVDRLAGDTTTP